MSKFVATPEQNRTLEALYSGIIVLKKHSNDDEVVSHMRLNLKEYAVELDKLGVPWSIQNKVASAGELKSNWDRYNRTVLDEIYDRKGE